MLATKNTLVPVVFAIVVSAALLSANETVASLLESGQKAYAEARYRDAEEIDNRAVEAAERDDPVVSAQLAECFNNLAAVYAAEAKYQAAESAYRQALRILASTAGHQIQQAVTLGNLGVALSYEAKYTEAEKLAQQSLDILQQQMNDADDLHIATALNNLGEVYNRQGAFAKAEPLFRRAIAIREKLAGPNSPDLALFWKGLAEVYQRQGKYQAAAEALERAIAMSEQALGPMHPQLAPLLSGLGSAYVAQRRYKEAGNVIGRALGILEKTVGPDHPDFAAALSNLASLDFYEHNYKRSVDRNRRALAIDEARFGPDHPLVAIYENNLASALILQHKYVEAEAALQHALRILDRPGLHEPQHLGDILINLGQVCAVTTRRDEALRYYQRAIEVKESALGPESASLVPVLRAYATLLRQTQEYALAEKAEVRAMGIQVRNTLRP